MNSENRIVHIDGLRGLAVLLMVLVHAAATWEPELSGAWLFFGVVVSGAGGLAAPLFVALLGWGMAQKSLPVSKRIWRAGFLFLCQFLVNLSAPHLFEPWTPGVLSLMGALVLLEPAWRRVCDRLGDLRKPFAIAFAGIVCLTFILSPWQGPSAWDSRVSTETAVMFLQHMTITGLYPVFPWVVFAWFGHLVASMKDRNLRERWLWRSTVAGLLLSAAVLLRSLEQGRQWALPTGDAALTFFPANGAFLIAALTGVSLLWWVAERFPLTDRLADLGRVSLTVYVFHFLPFTVFHAYDDIHRWNPALTVLVVVFYTMAWSLVGTWLSRRTQPITLEAWMKRLEPSSYREQTD